MTPLTSLPQNHRITPPKYRPATAPAPSAPRRTLVNAPRQRLIGGRFQHALFTPAVGTTWFRVLPPHADSAVEDWLYAFQVYDLAPRSAGFVPEIAVPASLAGANVTEDRIQIFQRFLASNYPHLVQRTPGSTAPLELYAKDRAACWIHVVRNGRGGTDDLPVRLWYGSFYRGSATLRPGHLRTLADMCLDEIPSLSSPSRLRFGDISHPQRGRLVTMRFDPSSCGPIFGGFSIEEKPTPLAQLSKHFAVHPCFRDLNLPIESTIECPSEELITEVLENYLGWQVRNGFADASVYEAYSRCFGEPVREDRRSGVIKRPVLVMPPDISRPATPSAVERPSSARLAEPKIAPSRIVDDLPELPLFAAAKEAPPLPLQQSKSALVELLRSRDQRYSMKIIADTLLQQHSAYLTIDDLDLIESVS